MARFAAGNITSLSRFAFGVGNLEWLNSETSKVALYWREIDQGTHGFIGRKLAGAWGNEGGPRGELIGGPAVGFGEGRGQKFIPFAATLRSEDELAKGAVRAHSYLRRLGNRGASTRGVVKHEITAHRFFERAAENFDPVAREKEAIAAAFENSGILGKPTRANVASALGRKKPTGRPRQQISSARAKSRLGGFLHVSVLSAGSQSLANVGGFTDFQRELTAANRLLAKEFADLVAAEFVSSRVRAATATGRLEEALLDRRNRFPA